MDEALQRLAAAARERPPGAWMIARGIRIAAWPEQRYPTAREIDDAASGRPALLRSFDHHALAAGAAALRLAELGPHTADPAGGIIERGPGGAPTGLLLESACALALRAVPPFTRDERAAHVRAALADLRARGFAEVHDMLATPLLADILLDLEARGELDVAVRLYATREHFDALADRAAESADEGDDADPAGAPTLARSEMVRLSGLKIFTDGTLNSRTAHMLRPFAHPIPEHPLGTALMSPDEIVAAIRHADARGYPIAAHAIGDAAVRAVLDALETAQPECLGQRIEHAQFVDETDVARFAELGVIASLQPCHLLTDIEAIERFTPDRAGRAFPLRDLMDAARDAGFEAEDLIWLGSDAPIVPPSPEDNRQAAVERRRAGMAAARAIGPAQSITPEEFELISAIHGQ